VISFRRWGRAKAIPFHLISFLRSGMAEALPFQRNFRNEERGRFDGATLS
jgi:hypothetical protein